MNTENTVASMSAAINQIVNTAGEHSQALFDIYTRQSVFNGVSGLLGFIFILISLFVVIFFAIKIYKKYEREIEEYSGSAPLFVTMTTISIILPIIITLHVINSISKIVNPEYHAIQQIVEDLSSITAK